MPPSREGFALRGPSISLDPRISAIRSDLADIRLAAYVFAPHYASPIVRRVGRAAPLKSARAAVSETLTDLVPGDAFEVLEFAGELAWGIAPASGLVGYLPAAALDASA